MSVALYMDEHVPRAITQSLRKRGIDVLTVQEDGFHGEPDRQIMDRAQALGRVIFTQDIDYLIESSRRQRSGITFTGVIFARQGRVAIGKCIADLQLIAGTRDPADQADRVQYLPL